MKQWILRKIQYLKKFKEKNQKVALKKLRIENKDEGIPITALREMCILKNLKHENIVELIEIIQDVDKIYLIFEFVDQDLKMFLDEHKEIKDINLVKVRFKFLI